MPITPVTQGAEVRDPASGAVERTAATATVNRRWLALTPVGSADELFTDEEMLSTLGLTGDLVGFRSSATPTDQTVVRPILDGIVSANGLSVEKTFLVQNNVAPFDVHVYRPQANQWTYVSSLGSASTGEVEEEGVVVRAGNAPTNDAAMVATISAADLGAANIDSLSKDDAIEFRFDNEKVFTRYDGTNWGVDRRESYATGELGTGQPDFANAAARLDAANAATFTQRDYAKQTDNGLTYRYEGGDTALTTSWTVVDYQISLAALFDPTIGELGQVVTLIPPSTDPGERHQIRMNEGGTTSADYGWYKIEGGGSGSSPVDVPLIQTLTEAAAVTFDVSSGLSTHMEWGAIPSVIAKPSGIEAGQTVTMSFKRSLGVNAANLPSFHGDFVFLDGGVPDFNTINADGFSFLEFEVRDDGGLLRLFEGSGLTGTVAGTGGGGGEDPFLTSARDDLVALWRFEDANASGEVETVVPTVSTTGAPTIGRWFVGNDDNIPPQDAAGKFGAAVGPATSLAFLSSVNSNNAGNSAWPLRDGSQSFSAAVWFNPTSTHTFVLMGVESSLTDLNWKLAGSAGGALQFVVNKGDGTTNDFVTASSGGGTGIYVPGVWNLAVASWDAATGTARIVRNDQVGVDAPVVEGVSTLYTGSTNGLRMMKGRADVFNGLLDHVGMWDKVLSDGEIQALFADTNPLVS